MSIDISWEALTAGQDGEALAETVRSFIHERFQSLTLPKFIHSVNVHSFDFGKVAPELELKDVCDPLPDFYEGDGESVSSEEEEAQSPGVASSRILRDGLSEIQPPTGSNEESSEFKRPPRPQLDTRFPSVQSTTTPLESPTAYMSRASTPGVPGGTTNLNSFHLPLSAGLPGAATPLAAFGGGPLPTSYQEYRRFSEQQNDSGSAAGLDATNIEKTSKSRMNSAHDELLLSRQTSLKERNVNDVQIVARLRYAGDVKLSLTAEILLDYPMDSFVGIPLTLNVTGLEFDGVAILAYIKSKAHFCFLSPEDADALIGREDMADSGSDEESKRTEKIRTPHHIGGLFEKIQVDSEIGQKASGKQVLKNVDKVERFVLDQVRSIFETEFVYPSFWTFLV